MNSDPTCRQLLDSEVRPQVIPRLHLFELHDQPWFPKSLRNALTEWLRAVWTFSKLSPIIAPVLARALAETQSTRIIDLCSGSSGPIIPVVEQLSASGITVQVLATDKYPDIEVMQGLAQRTNGTVIGLTESVDATNVSGLEGFRTMWNAFHHFQPDVARAILKDAHDQLQPIAVFELTERSLVKVITSFFASFFSVYFLIFKMNPKRLNWWMLTWLVPVIPFTVAWDGMVSHWRSYSKLELMSLTEDLTGFNWSVGKVMAPKGGFTVTYLVGLPVISSFS